MDARTERETRGSPYGARLCVYAAGGLCAALLPKVISHVGGAWVFSTYGKAYEPFELFGFCAAVALIAGAAWELRRRRGRPWDAHLPIIAILLVDLAYLTLLSEHSVKMWDWGCYEGAARLINEGANPYASGCYYYPPFTAQVLAIIYRVLKPVLGVAELETSRLAVWNHVFYFYQCAQLFLIHTLFYLCYRFARDLGLARRVASILVAALLMVNNPLFRSLWFNQVNLWLLILELVAILGVERYPLLSGAAVAVAGHIKLYPFVLLGPWMLTRRWRASVAALVGSLVIVLLQTRLGTHWLIWTQYLAAPFSDPKVTYFRNNSLQSVIHNAFTLCGAPLGLADAPLLVVVRIVQVMATLAVLAWFAVRFLRRDAEGRAAAAQAIALYGHSADALALALLVSPSAWEHHFVFALPLILWAVATRGTARPWQIGTAALLMLGVPTFDLFPFSYHRIAGLFWLLIVAVPRAFPLHRGAGQIPGGPAA